MTKNKFLSTFWTDGILSQILLFCVAFLMFSNTLGHDYTQDDAIVIYENIFTKQGIKGIPDILQHDTFYGFFQKEGKDKLVSGGRYRPLSQVMFALEWELFGDRPFIGHLINVILFAFLTLLIFNVLKLLLRDHFRGNKLAILAFLTALLFALHPIHTEVVANIKGRDEIMALFLSLATLYFVLKAVDTSKIAYFVLAPLSFLAALLSKENAITFLAVIPLAVFLFRKISLKKQLFQLLLLSIAVLLFMVIRTSVLGLDFGSDSMELMNNPFLKIENGKYVEFSLLEKSATILFTLGKYLQLLIFPHPLTHDYYPRQIAIQDFGTWQVWLSLLLYLGLTFFAIIKIKSSKLISFGILYFLITLSIVSNIVFPIGTNMSERFMFMPSFSFVLILSWALLKLKFFNKWLFGAALFSIIVLFSWKTFNRNKVWKDDFTLFTTDVKTSVNSAKVLNAAGGALVSKAAKLGDGTLKSSALDEAIDYLNRALVIHPNYKNAYLIKGNAYFYKKEYEKAAEEFSSALKLAPEFEEANRNLSIAYREAGKQYGQEKNDLKNALRFLELAYEKQPGDYETVRLFGIANALSGNNEKALLLFTKGTELSPENAGAFLNLGNVYFNLGDVINGRLNHERALELNPDVFNNKTE